MKINNKDTELTWGAWLLDGDADTFLQGPVAKPRYEYNWADGNGVEYDPNEVIRFEKTSFQFSLVFSGVSKTAVNSAIAAFLNEVAVGAGVSLSVPEVGRDFAKVFFSACGASQVVADEPYSIKVALTFIYNW